MSKFLILFLSTIFIAVTQYNQAFAESRNIILDKPIIGSAEVIHVEPDLKLWILPKRSLYDKLVQHTRSSNTKSNWKALLVQAESVDLSDYLTVIDDHQEPFVVRAWKETLKAAKGSNAEVECYSKNLSDGVLICRLVMNNINFSEAILREGFSKFTKHPGMTESAEKSLIEAESHAKSAKTGIWKPMYGLFRLPKDN